MMLSPKQALILECLKRHLVDWNVLDIYRWSPQFVPIGMAWSWKIAEFSKTADYRRRIYELRQLGYDIRKFQVGTRHGYVLVSEPEQAEVKKRA